MKHTNKKKINSTKKSSNASFFPYSQLCTKQKSKLTLGLSISMVMIGMMILWLIRDNDEELIYSEAPEGFSPDLKFAVSEEVFPFLNEQGGTALKDFTETFLKLEDIIVDGFPCLFGYQVLTWLLAHHQEIIMKPAPLISREGGYAQHISQRGLGRIELKARPDYLINNTTINSLHMVLRNEYFHRIADLANEHKPCSNDNRLLPFLNADGEIDDNLYKEFKSAVESAYDNIYKIKTALDNNDYAAIEKANKALSDYTPYVQRMKVESKKAYMQLRNAMITVDGQKIIRAGTECTLPDGKIATIPYDLAFIGITSESQNSKDDIAIMYTYHGNKASVFIRDFYDFDEMLNTAEDYKEKSEHMLVAEKGSNLEMFPAKIKQQYFGKFCQYMGRYTDVGQKDYCAIPSYAKCTMK